MKFEDIFKLNGLKCWKESRNCFKCEKIKVCRKIIDYEIKQGGWNPF